MDEDQIERAVLAYLKKKGYKNAENAFKNESKTQTHDELNASQPLDLDSSITNQIFFGSRIESGPEKYRDGYSKLRSWIFSSLDLYKMELLRILYPVFVHSYINLISQNFPKEASDFFNEFKFDHDHFYSHDLEKLNGLTSSVHLKESELVQVFQENKINIKMSQYSFELLMQFLHTENVFVMLSIINQHINLQIASGQPEKEDENENEIFLLGKSLAEVKNLNKKDIKWGVLEDSIEHKFENEKMEMNKNSKEKENEKEDEDIKKRKHGEGKQVTGKKKKEKLLSSLNENKMENSNKKNVYIQSNIPLPEIDEEIEEEILNDLRKRIQVNSQSLPSVCLFTVLNSDNTLNSVSFSSDGSQMAAGFSDSSIKIWNMKDRGKKMEAENEYSEILDKDAEKGHVSFSGHSGAIYATNFSFDSRFLLSASADCTVRLWSFELQSNLVCFKGHNFPVWDVQFCPLGHYFASCSHDKTARVWSMDRSYPLRIMAGHLSDVDCVRWHSNCNYICTGSSDKTVRLWDMQSGECVRIFTGHRGAVTSLAMSADGRHMASADEDGVILLWDIPTAKKFSPLIGHSEPVYSLAFSGEGSVLASGSADQTIRLWDVSSTMKSFKIQDKSNTATTRRLRLIKTLNTKSTPVYSIQFTRRNLLLAAGAFDPQN